MIKKLEFDDSIFDANNFQILDDIGLNKNKNSNLTHLLIEGVVLGDKNILNYQI